MEDSSVCTASPTIRDRCDFYGKPAVQTTNEEYEKIIKELNEKIEWMHGEIIAYSNLSLTRIKYIEALSGG